jgi:hypothetical protein
MGVLAFYQNAAHQYEVLTDNFEGAVAIRQEFYESLSEEQQASQNIDVRFGFRAMRDGTLAVAVWAPDIHDRAGEQQRAKWAGFQVDPRQFPQEYDRRFLLWAQRVVGGSWDVEDGPLTRLRAVIAEIIALTEASVDRPIFTSETSSKLVFPNAENDAAYRDAHSALYGFIIDGLDKATIAALAARIGVPGRFDNDRTIAALKKLVTDTAIHGVVFAPLEKVSAVRREADHGVQPAPTPFAAFDAFSTDVEAIVAGMLTLKTFLASALQLDVEQCVRRRQEKRYLPKFDSSRRSQANFSIVQVGSIVGKTIANVEYGFRKPRSGVHDSELVIMHFTDGSILSICTGSNAANLSREHEGLKPEDYSSTFILTFVPAVNPSPAATTPGDPS